MNNEENVLSVNERLDKIEGAISELRELLAQKVSENAQEVLNAKKNATTSINEINTIVKTVKQFDVEITALKTEIAEKRKSVDEIKQQSETDLSDANAFQEKTKESLIKLKAELENFQTKWEKELANLKDTYNTELTELNQKYNDEFVTRAKEIESLLPGATSAGLASAFADRKKAVEQNKTRWTWLLILSALGLVFFGIYAVCSKSAVSVGSFSGRLIIVSGLVFLEEFARRNFNIISRLSEAYAYKEALAKSYLGYKKQMEETEMPNKETKGDAELMRMFLEKLEDEPGKSVFDKEKQINGATVLLDTVAGGSNTESPTPTQVTTEFARGTFLSKIGWPVVVIVGIVAVAICVLAFVLRNAICG